MPRQNTRVAKYFGLVQYLAPGDIPNDGWAGRRQGTFVVQLHVTEMTRTARRPRSHQLHDEEIGVAGEVQTT